MTESSHITCPFCGFNNELPLPQERCVSCGGKIDDGKPHAKGHHHDDGERRYQQEGFSAPWCGISLLIVGVLTAAIVAGVPMVVPALDFEGSAGMLVSIPVWFISGVLIGLISPGKTFLEPVVATFLVAMPTAFLLFQGQTVKTMPAFMYVLMSALGVLFSLIGSYAGERIQVGPVPKHVE
jgi:hypothetical protein